MRRPRMLVGSVLLVLSAFNIARADTISTFDSYVGGSLFVPVSNARLNKIATKRFVHFTRHVGDLEINDDSLLERLDLRSFNEDKVGPEIIDEAAVLSAVAVEPWRTTFRGSQSADLSCFQPTNAEVNGSYFGSLGTGYNFSRLGDRSNFDARGNRNGQRNRPAGPNSAFHDQGENGQGSTATATVKHGFAAVPEPSSMLLFGSGAIGLIGAVRRKLLQ